MRQVTATALIGSPPRRRERGHLGFDTQVRRQQSRRRKAAPRRASANNHSSQPAAGRVRGDRPWRSGTSFPGGGVNLGEQAPKNTGIVLVHSDETYVEKRHVLPRLGKGGSPKQGLDGVGRGHQPTQAFSVGNHPSLLEGALIPAARDANDMVVAEGNEKVGGLKIFPATAVNKALNIVNRGKLLARVVAVQTIDNLRQ